MASTTALFSLGAGVAVAVHERRDGECGGGLAPIIDGEPAPAPYGSVDLTLAAGGVRSVLVFRCPEGPRARRVLLRAGAGAVDEPVGAFSDDLSPLDADAVLGGLDPAGELRLMRLLVDFCRIHFRLAADPRFIAACHRLVAARAVSPQPAAVVAAAGQLALAIWCLPRALGRVRSSLLLDTKRIAKPVFPACMDDAATAGGDGVECLWLLDRDAVTGRVYLLLFAEHGLGVVKPELRSEPEALVHWVCRRESLPAAARSYILRALAASANVAPQAVAVAREIQILRPLPARRVCDPAAPVGGAIDLAVGGCGGLFLAGWLHDPHGLVAGLRVVTPFGARRAIDAPLHRFSRHDIAETYGATADRAANAGFAVHLPDHTDPATALQYQVDLILRSGAVVTLVSPLAEMSPAAARDAVLAAIPAAQLTPQALAGCIAPAATALHRAFLDERQPPEVHAYGRRLVRPRLSVIVPLYRNLAYLRTQHAVLAADEEFADCELIYVLDSPEQWATVERLLRGLHAIYGRPFRLAAMAANGGFAAACNAGAALAGGRQLVFLNSDVVPADGGWLGRLEEALTAGGRVGAVGAKLLYEDDSLQHAGLYFAADADGSWRNRHFFKGFPRDYPEANRARGVPAVTGAAMLVRRAAFERVGGFSEDYIIADFEDSDLCLKLRANGFDIRYAPGAELYHFERRSLPLHGAYVRSAASEYNRALHAQRWHHAMARWAAVTKAATHMRGGAPLATSRRGRAELRVAAGDVSDDPAATVR